MKIFHKKFTRRRILILCAAGLIPKIGWGRQVLKEDIELSNTKTRQIATRLVEATFSDPSRAMRLGALYMHELANGQDLNSLVNAIIRNNSLLADKISGTGNRAIKDALQWQIEKDFEYGEVVNIDGWVVACTEARLSALTNFV